MILPQSRFWNHFFSSKTRSLKEYGSPQISDLFNADRRKAYCAKQAFVSEYWSLCLSLSSFHLYCSPVGPGGRSEKPVSSDICVGVQRVTLISLLYSISSLVRQSASSQFILHPISVFPFLSLSLSAASLCLTILIPWTFTNRRSLVATI